MAKSFLDGKGFFRDWRRPERAQVLGGGLIETSPLRRSPSASTMPAASSLGLVYTWFPRRSQGGVRSASSSSASR